MASSAGTRSRSATETTSSRLLHVRRQVEERAAAALDLDGLEQEVEVDVVVEAHGERLRLALAGGHVVAERAVAVALARQAAGVEGAAGERVGDAAPLPLPRLAALLDGQRGDQQPDDRIQPPRAPEHVAQQPEQQRPGQVGAEHVLPALALRGGGAELVGEPLLGDAERRHEDHARDREPDPDPAVLGPLVADERAHRLDRDVGREQEELDRDELLRAGLGGRGEHPLPGEAPDDDQAREALDRAVEAEADERDRARDDAGRDRDAALDGHPREAQPRERADAAGEPAVGRLVDARLGRGRRRQHRELEAHALTPSSSTASSSTRPRSVRR